MNKYLKTIAIFSCATIIAMLSGCSQNQTHTEEHNIEQLQEMENISPTELADLLTKKDNTMIWEKDYTEPSPLALKFDSTWNKEILLGNNKLTTDTLYDVSMIDNMFFDKDKDFADLKNMYNVAQEDYQIKTNEIQIGKLSKCGYQLNVSSIPTDTDNQFDVIVHKLTATAFFNEAEGGFQELKKNAQESDKLSLGSSFQDTIKTLGQPQYENETEDNQGTLKWITVSYHTDTADLQLVFTYDKTMNKNDAVLTTFAWTANKASSVAHQTITEIRPRKPTA